MSLADHGPSPVSNTTSRRSFLQRTAALAAAAFLPRVERAAAGDFVENPCNFVTLSCGRRLAFAEFGDPHGRRAVFLHHGVPNCRLEADVFLAALREQPGARLIAIDRPGFGRSDPDAASTFQSWPADLAAVADSLHIDRFGLLGTSGGTPYTLAVARAFPDRAVAVAIGSAMAPLEAVDTAGSGAAKGALLAQNHPAATTLVLGHFAAGLRRHPDRMPNTRQMGPAERDHLSSPGVLCEYARTVTEAMQQGPAEVVRVAAHLARPWACWLKEVCQHVLILQGCCDRITPPNMARYLAGALPNAEARLIENEGHMSLPWHYAATLLAAALPAL